MIDLNLHEYKDQLNLKKEQDVVYIFDIIRKKYLVFQPEEMVRQLLIQHLIKVGYPKEKIQVEKGIDINGLYRRFDIIIYDSSFHPYILIECKAHTVSIDQSTFDQISSYNLAVKAPYLIVCNGISTYSCHLDFETKKIENLTYIPKYQ
ncbi:MAG: type I restriction enzyme HsdR N-terminal domain-containing protein [Saprospiraceae bacterium]|nr:type I restriction enzyme HsdR N-terminal domain-containing protein [Saprospiraceae bacterium]